MNTPGDVSGMMRTMAGGLPDGRGTGISPTVDRRGHHRTLRQRGPVLRGFTLLELMIVIAIILILATLGAGRYEQSVIRAKEVALKTDLKTMRTAIDQYTLDKAQGPSSLDDLVSAGYLREVPTDPITRRKDWVTETSDILLSPEQTTTGISDVHSASDQSSTFENTPYSSW